MRILTDAGETIVIGTTEAEPTIGIVDYSRRQTDAFGVTTVVERNFSRRMSVRVAVPSDLVDVLQRRLAALRAMPVTWIADDRFASLSVRGFFKDLEFDLAVPPLSFCTLTVESIAGGDVPADAGGDPAPSGVPSTLQLLQPVTIAGAALVSSSVAENDAPAWAAATTYAKGARVISVATHRIYESLVAGNKGNDPTAAGGTWLDLGPTNRWAMFDDALGTSTSSAASIVVRVNAGAATAVALLDVKGATVRVQATGYDRTLPVGDGAITFLDLPTNAGQITVTIAGTGTKSVGTLLVGRIVALGVTEASPTAGITDYSRKEVDDFGEVTIVERPFAKRMAARALIDTASVDLVANRLAAVRARPCLWIGQAGLDSLTIYGFFKDFAISVGPTVSKLSLSIEGLSTAGELKPLGSAVNWPDIADPDGTKPAPNADKTSENVAKDTVAVGGKPAAEVVYAIGDLYEALGTTQSAQQYADAAQVAKTAAETAKTQSQDARDAAQGALTLAQDARSGAEIARGLAQTARDAAQTAQGGAVTARTAAETARTGAETALGLTTTAKAAAEQASTNAQAALSGATSARETAIAKANEAATSATSASGSASSAAGSATTATNKAGEAGNSATAAAGSALVAQSSPRDASFKVASMLPERITDPAGSYFFFHRAASQRILDPAVVTSLAGYQSKISLGANGYVFNPANGDRLHTVGVIPAVPGRVYEATFEWLVDKVDRTIGTIFRLSAAIVGMSADYATGGDYSTVSIDPITTGPVSATTVRVSLDTLPGIGKLPATIAFLRAYAVFTNDTPSSASFVRMSLKDVTEVYRSEQQASAAASSASAASTSATNAGTSASAANQLKLDAATEAGKASTSATQAASSATNAAGSASSATTQADLAAGSATNAGNSATAAAGSATTAGTHASNAGNSASAANTAAISAGSSYSQVKAKAIAALPDTLAPDTHGLNTAVSGSPETRPDVPAAQFANGAVVSGPNFSNVVAWKGVVPWVLGRIYEVTTEVSTDEGGPGTSTSAAGYARVLDSTYGVISAVPERYSFFAVAPGATERRTTRFGMGVTPPGAPGVLVAAILNDSPTNAFVRFGALLNYTNPTGNVSRLKLLQVRDVTEKLAAESSAAAAATSATTADTRATAAGASATAAAASATTASTKAGEAGVSATNSASSATNAAGSANSASTSAGVAATARDDAQTARGQAQGSASAAATSASNAATSATNAGTSATTASTAANTATTKAGEASAAATRAATSETNAAGSANSASASATVAATARDNAQTAASAAATSASTAGTKSTEAGNSASAASASATNAETARGQASTFANNASNSATAAAGSATTATQQAGVATTASSAATVASEAARLALAEQYPASLNATIVHASGPAGANSTLVPISTQYPAWVTDNGGTITPSVGWAQVSLIAPVTLVDGEIYEFTAVIENIGPVAARTMGYLRCLNADYSQSANANGTVVETQPGDKVTVRTRIARGLPATPGVFILAAGVAHVRLLQLLNRTPGSTAVQSNAQMKVHALYVRNVTGEQRAADSASAAAGSASAAGSSQTAAGQSATAAAASATNAETARGQASTFASQASTSATNAAGSANAASQSAGVAATARDAATNVASGNLVQKSIFDDGTIGAWSASLTTVVDSGPASLPRVRAALMGAPNDYAEGDFRPTTPGRILEVSGWVKAPTTTSGPGFGIQERNVSGGTTIRHTPVTVAANVWTQFSHKITVSSTGVEWRPLARQNANAGVRFTDLVIRDVTERDAAQAAASAAATSESNAAASKSGAESSASAANTAKVAAETARGQAQTAATNAATSETNALGSKNAAAASATVAASTAADIVTMDGNFLFNQGTAGWATSPAGADQRIATTAFTFVPAYSGASNVLTTGPGRSDLFSWNKFSVQPGRTYKLSARFGISVTSGTVQMYIGLQTYGANGASVGTNNGYSYILVPGQQFGPGWVEREIIFTTATLNAGATDVRLLALTNYANNATGSLGFDYFILEDITESAAASSSALAAATSASAASTSQTQAGTSASAANQSRIDAQTANNNAQQAATTATTAAATSTAAAASATTAAVVASRFGGQSLSRNGSFQEPDTTWVYSSTVNYKLPLGWSSWAREGTPYLAPSSLTNAYGPQAPLQIDRAGTGLASGVVQTIPFMAKGWYVLEADVTLEDGLHTGAGMYVDFGGTAGNARLHFGSDVDLAEEVSTGGMGSVNRKFSKLVYCSAMATNVRLYLMASWNTFGGNTGFLRTIWHKGHIRPAAQGEIDGNKARYDSGVNAARIEQVNTTLTNNLGSLATQTNTLTARFEETPRTYIIRSAGLGASNTGKLSGLFNGKDERIGAVPSRSYRVFVKQPNNDTWATQNFDIQGGGQAAINAMVGYLNGIGTGQVVVVVTADEPEANRTNGNLITALRRVGAGPLYTSPEFVYRGAYALVGRAGLGPGNGLEWLAGSSSGAADAWIEESFSLIGNRIVGAGAGKAIESKVAQEAAALATATSAVAQRASNLESRAGNLESKTSITEQTVADLKSGAASARLELLAAAPGGRAKMTIRSDATSAGIDLEGDVNFSGKVIFNNGTVMFVQGLGFGSTGQFLEWLGPSKANLNQCTEAEAIRYVKMDGSAYFRGTFLAGSLRSSTANPGVGQNVTADTGPISSNGGAIVVQGSWDYTWTQVLEFPATTQGIQNFDSAASANGATDRGANNWQGMQTPTLGSNSLAIQKDGTTVASVSTTTGSRMTSGWRPIAGDSPGRLTVTTTMALSTTYSDPERSTRQRAFRAVLTRGYVNIPTSQFVGITTVE